MFKKLWWMMDKPLINLKILIVTVLVLFSIAFSVAYAQPTVLVNGIELEQVDNTTVNGIDYVGASELSAALGATFNLLASGSSLQMELAGQFLLMPVFDSVQDAQDAELAIEMRRFGTTETLASTGALRAGDSILVPVKPIIVAFGGSVDYVPEVNSVIAVFERAELIVLAYPQANSSVERFVFNLSIPVNYKIQNINSLSVLNILFSQTNSQLGTQNLTGRGFQKALFRNFAGDVEFRLELRPGFQADIFSTPPEGPYAGYKGVNVVVDVLTEEVFEQRHAVAEASQAAQEAEQAAAQSVSTLVNTIGGDVVQVPNIQAVGTPDTASNQTNASTDTQANTQTSTQVSTIGSTPPTVVSSIGSNPSSFTTPAPAVVSVAGTGEPVTITARSSHIVLDPVPLKNANLQSSDTSFDFVAGLAAELQRNGFSSSITRMKGDIGNPESRRNAGFGAAAFISINQANLPAGTFNLYHLGEVASVQTLDLALRRNAESALSNSTDGGVNNQEEETAALRRKVLLNLSSDVDEAATLAQAMSRNLSANGYQLTNIQALPLYILGGAVGKGVVVEFSQQDFGTPALQTALLEAILQLNLQ